MRKQKKFSKVACWILAFAMIMTLIPVNLFSVKAETATTVTVHVKPDASSGWTKVYAKLGGGSTWTKLKNYEFMQDGFGGIVSANAKNEGWYSYKVTLDADDATSYLTEGLNGLFNCGSWGDTNQAGNVAVKFEEGKNTEVWYTISGSSLTLLDGAPTGWDTSAEIKNPAKEAIAEYTNVKLYFLNSENWETPAINAWSDVSIGAGENVAINGWGTEENPNMKPKMIKDGDSDWYYATLEAKTTGKITGLQFINAATGTVIQMDKDSKSELLSEINSKKGAETVSLYYAYDKIWTSKEEVKAPAEPAVDSCTVTVHFNNAVNNWDNVAVYFAQGTSWDAVPDYEYCKANYGGLLEADSKNNGWYSFKFTLKKPFAQTHIKFNEGGWTAETGQYDINVDDITADTMELWLQPAEAGTKKNLESIAKPEGWVNNTAIDKPINPATLLDYKSPVINADDSVLIQYKKKDTDTFTKLYLMGTVTDWGNGKEMTYDKTTGVYSIVINKADAVDGDIVVNPGSYQYKFRDDNGNWFTDPANKEIEGGNSALSVPGMVIAGQTTAGDGKFEFAAQGSKSAAVKSWGVYSDEACTKVHDRITASMDEADHTKATIHVAGAATGYYYVKVTYEENSAVKTQVKEFYHTNRALIYEYTYKEDSKYKDKSDIYTWYNLPFNPSFPFVKEGNTDKKAAYVAMDDNISSFGYIVRLESKWSGDDVSDREYGDRTINVNEADRYTKVRGGEGIEKPYVLSTGKTGYDNGIVFRYRDDDLFYNGAMDSITSVKLMLKAPGADTYAAYDMTYDANDELYIYKLQNGETPIATGIYQFYYKVTIADVEKAVQDLYYVADNAETVEGVKAASIEYQNYDYKITTSVTPEAGVNSDQNPVVSVGISRTEGSETVDTIKNEEIASISADITELGYTGQKVNVSPITGKAALYVKENVAAGNHEVPITIEDKYGNTHNTVATVKVVAKTGSTPDWDESIIYFLLTDRFYDGNTDNNTGVNKTLREDYHGGDFAGLTQKLDYIDSLGVNTIWITPVVDNIESFYSDEINQNVGGYAGYWACDFTKLDEHLGTTAEFDKLLDEAHARGIKVMLDIVVNHAGYDKVTKTGEWKKDGNAFNGMIRPKEEAGSDSITQWLSDLPDFMTENQEVRSKLIAWQKAWATHTTANGNSVDYFRVDTVKHVDHETWSQLKSEIAEEDPDFKMIGEYYGASCINTGNYLADGQMDALLDFDFKSIAKQFVDGKIDSAEISLESRNTSISNAITMGQFLSSHDETGFLTSVGGDISKMKVAAALELTAKGIPIIYYGEEINLTGDTTYGSDGNNRYDMQFDNLTADQAAMMEHYKKLIAARNAKMNVFAKGDRTTVAGSDEDGYLVFKRTSGSDYAYVGLNTTAEAKQVEISVDASLANVKDLYSGNTYPVNGGKTTVTIPASTDGGTVILVAGDQQSSGGGSTAPVNPDPSTPDNTTVTKNPDGTTTETKTETTKNESGKEVEVTVTTDKDADGNVTGSKEVSVIAEAAENVSATVTVQKDAEGKVTEAKAEVAVTGTSGKTSVAATISGDVVSQITDAADTKDVTVSVSVTSGDKSYTVKAAASDLTAGAKLKVVAYDKETKKHVLVNAKTYTVSKDGTVKVALPAGCIYKLVTPEKAASIEKSILKTVSAKKSSTALKTGKTTTMQMSSKLNMKNVSKITYTSSKPSVAIVNKKTGKIRAKKKGTTTIKVKVILKSGATKTVTMKITVK